MQAVPTYRNPLRRIEWVLDDSRLSRTAGAKLTRIALAALFAAYGILAETFSIVRDHDVKLTAFSFLIGAAAILSSRLGMLSRYFIPVFLGLFAYATASGYATDFRLGVHYKPQLWAEQHLLPGTLPTVWLQQHLYHGRTGVLEALSVLFYVGHFFVPLIFGAALVLTRRGREFKTLMFTILGASIAATITFVLAPTAPPWLAAEHGYLSGVHNILKSSLADLHMTSLANVEGDPSKYDITAALPSLHTTFPVVCLIVAARARLPRWAVTALAVNLVGVIFSIVYTGQHYFVDVVVGAAYGIAAWLLVTTLSRLELRAARAEAREPAAGAARPASNIA